LKKRREKKNYQCKGLLKKIESGLGGERLQWLHPRNERDWGGKKKIRGLLGGTTDGVAYLGNSATSVQKRRVWGGGFRWATLGLGQGVAHQDVRRKDEKGKGGSSQ